MKTIQKEYQILNPLLISIIGKVQICKRKNQVVLLMITNDKQSDKIDKWHYIALKSVNTDNGFNRPISLSRLFRGITSNNNGNFYCLSCLHSFRTDNALKKHGRLCNNHYYCHIEIPTRDNNTLKYNHGVKSLKVPWVIYADFECLLIKQQLCQSNPEKSYTEKESIHESCGYSIDLGSSFDSKQDKYSFYRGRDCSKRFCEDLKKHAIKINFNNKEFKEFCYDENEKNKFNYIKKLGIIVIIQENLEELLIAFVT